MYNQRAVYRYYVYVCVFFCGLFVETERETDICIHSTNSING